MVTKEFLSFIHLILGVRNHSITDCDIVPKRILLHTESVGGAIPVFALVIELAPTPIEAILLLVREVISKDITLFLLSW